MEPDLILSISLCRGRRVAPLEITVGARSADAVHLRLRNHRRGNGRSTPRIAGHRLCAQSNLSRRAPPCSGIERGVAASRANPIGAAAARTGDQAAGASKRTYWMLSSTNSAILRLRNRLELFDAVCRIAVTRAAYDRVVISLIDADGGILRPRAWAGMDSVSLRAYELHGARSRSGLQSTRPGGTRHPLEGAVPRQ